MFFFSVARHVGVSPLRKTQDLSLPLLFFSVARHVGVSPLRKTQDFCLSLSCGVVRIRLCLCLLLCVGLLLDEDICLHLCRGTRLCRRLCVVKCDIRKS